MDTDRNLLFGMLALQADLLDNELTVRSTKGGAESHDSTPVWFALGRTDQRRSAN
jgi:hypothetical protein